MLPKQLQSSARPISLCHSHTMTSAGLEPATIGINCYIQELAAITHCATGDDVHCYEDVMIHYNVHNRAVKAQYFENNLSIMQY